MSFVLLLALGLAPVSAAVIIDERQVRNREMTPHGNIGMSTIFRISDAAPNRTMEFRKRILDRGAAVGPHPIEHDQIYYVLSGEGDVTSDGVTMRLKPGMTAYLYKGATVSMAQVGHRQLTVILAYPNH